MQKILIVLNPHAGGGAAGRVWRELEPLLWDRLGELVVVVTEKPADVAARLEDAYTNYGIRRVIALGGDGTNHALINAVVALNERHADPMIYGNIPIGTGRDWARGLNIPTHDIRAMAAWIVGTQPQATDIGMLTLSNGGSVMRREYFLNIASAGIGGVVGEKVERVKQRRAWTFLRATVAALLSYQPQRLTVSLDGNEWYEGGTYIVAVANGSTFGHGMRIAPDAAIHDGLFDVVLVKDVSRFEVLRALGRVYDGSHLTHPAVIHQRAKQVEIAAIPDVRVPSVIPLELDGEVFQGNSLHFQLRPNLVQILS